MSEKEPATPPKESGPISVWDLLHRAGEEVVKKLEEDPNTAGLLEKFRRLLKGLKDEE